MEQAPDETNGMKDIFKIASTYEKQLDEIRYRVSLMDEKVQDLQSRREQLLIDKTTIITEMGLLLKACKKNRWDENNQDDDSDADEGEDDESDEEQLMLGENEMDESDVFNNTTNFDIKASSSNQKISDLKRKKDQREYKQFIEFTKEYLKGFEGPKSYPPKLKEKILEFAAKFGMKKVGREAGIPYTNLKTWKRKKLLKVPV